MTASSLHDAVLPAGDELAPPSAYSTPAKVALVAATLRNWPMLALDRVGVVPFVTYRSRRGQTLRCRARSTDVAEAVVVLSGREYDERFCTLADGATVIDAGANIGAFAVWVSAINAPRRLRGVAVEPFAPNRVLLERNLAANDCDFAVVDAAVWHSVGTVSFDTDADADAVSISDSGAAVVATTTLAELVADCSGHVDLLKMDIEGAEHDVLAPAATLLAGCVDRLVCEIHGQGPGRDMAAVVAALEPHFSCVWWSTKGGSGLLYAHNRGA